MRRALGAVLFWLACYLLASCAHRYQSHQTATRTEETRAEWQTAETAVSQTQSVATEKRQGTKKTRRWAPDGKLLEEVIEQWGSDGRVQVSSAASSSASATGADFRSVVARSSSSKQSDTKAGYPSPLWLLVLAPVGAAAWALRRWIRAHIPFL